MSTTLTVLAAVRPESGICPFSIPMGVSQSKMIVNKSISGNVKVSYMQTITFDEHCHKIIKKTVTWNFDVSSHLEA